MRGVYTAQNTITGLNASKTLMYLTAPSTKVVEILGATVTNNNNATNFQMEVGIYNISSLGTPTATAVTPTPHEAGDQAAASTVKANVTASEPTKGSVITMEGAASLVGYRFEPPTEADRIIVTAGSTIDLYMNSTPTSFNADVRMTFREIG